MKPHIPQQKSTWKRGIVAQDYIFEVSDDILPEQILSKSTSSQLSEKEKKSTDMTIHRVTNNLNMGPAS